MIEIDGPCKSQNLLSVFIALALITLSNVSLAQPNEPLDLADNAKAEAVNTPPVIRSSPKAEVYENKTFKYRIKVRDVDDDDLLLSLENAPAGMVLADNTIRWTPSYQQAGDYNIKLWVSDGTDRVQQLIALSVINVNRSPDWQSQKLMPAIEAEQYSAQLKASDADLETLSYRLENAPKGLTIDRQGKLSWLPTYDQAGSYRFIAWVSDGIDAVKQKLSLTVKNSIQIG